MLRRETAPRDGAPKDSVSEEARVDQEQSPATAGLLSFCSIVSTPGEMGHFHRLKTRQLDGREPYAAVSSVALA